MTSSTRRATLGAILAAPLAPIPQPASAIASTSLLRLVQKYEADHRALHDEMDRLDGIDRTWSEETSRLITACGELRAAIALQPCNGLPDVLLKVRAFALSDDPDSGWFDLRSDIKRQGGHAYDMDVAHAVMLDLMRMV